MDKITGENYGFFLSLYDYVIDECKTGDDIIGLTDRVNEAIKEIDDAISIGEKKVTSRKLKESEYDSSLFDPKWGGFKGEKEFIEDAYARNKDTIDYIKEWDEWDDRKEANVAKSTIDDLHRANKALYNKTLIALEILEKGIVVNKVDVEGFKETLSRAFNWIKDITTSDKTKMKEYGVQTTYAVYNAMNDALEFLGGEFLEKGIGYLEDEDDTIPVHIDTVEEATKGINALIAGKKKTVVFTVGMKKEDGDYGDYDDYKELINNLNTMTDIDDEQTIAMGIALMKGKKLSSGFKWYIAVADMGIKTYSDNKEIVKALTDFKKAIESLMSYIDSNTKLVKLNKNDIDKEMFDSIDHENIDPDSPYIVTNKTVDEEAIFIPIAIAAGAYMAYKAAEAAMIENYGKKSNVDLNSFDANNGTNNGVITLNYSTDILDNLDELITSKNDHLITIASDNIKATDAESFDVFKGLASTGLAKASRAFDTLKAMLKTNTQEYRDAANKHSYQLDKEIGVPRGYVGNLLDVSVDLLNASVNITTIKSNIDTTITELSSFINSDDSRESMILNSSYIDVIDKNSKDLYILNTKYLTNGREDRAKVYDLIANVNDLSIISSNLRNASKLINPVELTEIKNSLTMVDSLVKTIVSNQNKFSKVKMKEIGLLIDHLISYVSGVATLVYLKNSVDIMIDDIKKVI